MAVNAELQAVFLRRLAELGFAGKDHEFAGVQMQDPANVVGICTLLLPQPEWCPYSDVLEMQNYMKDVAKQAADHFASWAIKRRAIFACILKPRFCYLNHAAVVLFYKSSVSAGNKVFCHCDVPDCVPRCDIYMRITHRSHRS